MDASTPSPKLLLIDGLNIVRRVYEANPAPDTADKARRASRAALSSFARALAEHQPTHALAAFDHGGQTWRHALYSRYRQARKPMPQALRDSLPDFYCALREQLSLEVISTPGVEADDVLASVALRWKASRGRRAIVLSTDKDLCQLIPHGIEVRDHFKREWRDAAWVDRTFGVPPELLGDLLALMGDAVDGVPGVDGIGVKTAARLLREHGGLEQVLAAAESIRGASGEKLRCQAERARLSQQLVAFRVDTPLGLSWSRLQRQAGRAPAPVTMAM